MSRRCGSRSKRSRARWRHCEWQAEWQRRASAKVLLQRRFPPRTRVAGRARLDSEDEELEVSHLRDSGSPLTTESEQRVVVYSEHSPLVPLRLAPRSPPASTPRVLAAGCHRLALDSRLGHPLTLVTDTEQEPVEQDAPRTQTRQALAADRPPRPHAPQPRLVPPPARAGHHHPPQGQGRTETRRPAHLLGQAGRQGKLGTRKRLPPRQ